MLKTQASKLSHLGLYPHVAKQFYPPPANCVLYLPGYPPQGATIIDHSGNGNHGTITGATWVRLPSGLWVLNFGGTSDWVNCGNDAETQLQQFLAMGWVKAEAQPSDMMSHALESSSGWALTLNAADDIYMGDNYQAILARWTPSSINPFDGTWHHWAFYRDADNLTGLICDGLQRATLAYATAFGFGNLQIGRRSQAEANYLKGQAALLKLIGGTPSNATCLALALQSYQQERHLFGV